MAEDKSKPIDGEEELVHTCKDEFATERCKACAAELIKELGDVAIITDKQLCPEKIREWRGHVFKCTECETDSIMTHMKYCGNCGKKVVIQSIELTMFIRAGGKHP